MHYLPYNHGHSTPLFNVHHLQIHMLPFIVGTLVLISTPHSEITQITTQRIKNGSRDKHPQISFIIQIKEIHKFSHCVPCALHARALTLIKFHNPCQGMEYSFFSLN